MSRQPQADLTTMWKALEADAALIEKLIGPMVRPEASPNLDDLQRAVTGERCMHLHMPPMHTPGGGVHHSAS
jgi:hypothetical protein